MSEEEVNKIDSIKKTQQEVDQTGVSDVVAQRLTEEAQKGAKSQANKENVNQEDPNRAISLGELRKLIAEINGSFERVSKFLETVGNQVNDNVNQLGVLHSRVSRLEQRSGINYTDTLPEAGKPGKSE